MNFLYILSAILLAIIAFFVIILSARVKLTVRYDEKIYFTVKYLFFKFQLLPWEQKDKKPKKKKPEKKPETAPAEAENAPKRNIFKDYYKYRGVAGVTELISETARIMSGSFKSMFRHFIIKDLFLDMTIAGFDAADTALRYGKASAAVFTALGKICSAAKVRRYNAEVSPDFLAEESKVSFYANCSVRPIFIVNAAIVMLFKLFFKVIIKLFRAKPADGGNACGKCV